MILEKILIPGEDIAQLRQLATGLIQTWHPADQQEMPFVEQLIYHTWLAERLRNREAQIWAEDASEKAEKRAAGIQRQIAVHERSISRATRDLVYLQKIRAKTEQSQFEAEIASWPEPEEEKQTQFEYPPIPKSANEANFPTFRSFTVAARMHALVAPEAMAKAAAGFRPCPS